MSKDQTNAAQVHGSGPFALFEEEGQLRCGKLLAEAPASVQIEQASGRRSKVKQNHMFMRFSQPAPQDLLVQAKAMAAELDVAFIWETCNQEIALAFNSLSNVVQVKFMLFHLHIPVTL